MIEYPTDSELRTLKMIIYVFTNKITGQQYVGKSINKFIDRYVGCRWWEKPSNKYIKHSVEKYGLENFQLSILEYGIENNNKLKELERYYIKNLNTIYPNGYNYLEGGEEMVHTQASREYIAESLSKDYIFFDHKLNQEIKVHNLSKFCRDNNLSRSMMICIYKKRKKRHRHYTLPGIKLKTWSIVSPDGELIVILEGELNRFCRERGMHKNGIVEMCNGSFSQYLGWTPANKTKTRK